MQDDLGLQGFIRNKCNSTGQIRQEAHEFDLLRAALMAAAAANGRYIFFCSILVEAFRQLSRDMQLVAGEGMRSCRGQLTNMQLSASTTSM